MATLLIDADILVYRAISSVEQETEWEPDVWTLTADLKDAREAFEDMLSFIRAEGQDQPFKLCFSDSKNFRKDLNPTYKGNRAGVRKPVGFKAFRQSIIDHYDGIIKPHLEADDVIGILATKPGSDFIIVSADKDLRTVPGAHLIDSYVVNIGEHEADLTFYTQVLTGDQADGYSGCPGIGPKKAEQILAKADGNYWSAIVSTFEKNGLTEEDAIMQARMARILRWSDWNSGTQEVKLWTPNS